MASSTEEVSGPDLSAGSQNPDHFGVFKDFDFLEYESESVEVKSKTIIYLIILSELWLSGSGAGLWIIGSDI